MMRWEMKVFMWFAALGLLGACASDKTDDYIDPNQPTGELQVQLVLDDLTKAPTDTPEVNPRDFKVEILNASGEVLKTWEKYAQVPSKVKLNTGRYTLRATYGSSSAVGFTAHCFKGEQTFDILPQQLSNIVVTCALNNAKVIVVFGESLPHFYVDYKAEVKSLTFPTAPVITFTKNEQRPAFFPVGNLQVKLFVTDSQGVSRSYIAETVAAGARDFITIRLETTSPTGELDLSITTDTETDDQEHHVLLPAFLLPKPAPRIIEAEGFDASGFLDVLSGETPPDQVALHMEALGVIRSCQVTVTSPQLAMLGWPETFDLANMEEPLKMLLQSHNLRWIESMNGATLAQINFSDFVQHLLGTLQVADPTLTFKVKVSDAFSQECETELTIQMHRKFELNPISEGQMWARKVDFSLTASPGTSADRIVLQSQVGDGEWEAVSFTVLSQEGDQMRCSVPLPSNSARKLRAIHNEELTTVERSVLTEVESQIPGSGFEDWYNTKVYKGTTAWVGIDIYEHFPYAQGNSDPWWSSRNPLTTSQRSGASCYYTSYSGTVGVPGRSGSAAEISTLGWGTGNTYPGSPDIVKFRTAGLLFVGRYDLSQVGNLSNNDNVNRAGTLSHPSQVYGKPFASRPSKVRFYYKYAPINSESFRAYAVVENREDGVVELGRAELVSATPQNNFQQMDLDVHYGNTDLKATHIYVVFVSSTADGPSTKGIKGSIGAFSGYADSKNVGSVLTVDDLELIY